MMESVHSNLNVLSGLEKYLDKKVLFISENTPERSQLYNWAPSKIIRQIFYQWIKACDMAFIVMANASDYDIIVVFEHKPWYSLMLYTACAIKKKPTFFIIHGEQQTYPLSYIKLIGFKMFLYFERRFKFWPVHLEKSDHEFTDRLKFSKSKIVIQLPFANKVTLETNEKKLDSKIKIGIAGIIRKDKPIMPIVEILEEYAKKNDSVEIYFGTPFWQMPDAIKNKAINLTDTSDDNQYNAFLRSLDIVVGYYQKESFFYRSSGVINDSVGAGCFMVVPNYPVFKEQINNPVKVGETYSGLNDIINALDKSVQYIKNNKVDFVQWQQFRGDETIVKSLSDQMKSVLEC